MPKGMNEPETEARSVTIKLPEPRQRSLSYPFAFVKPLLPAEPTRPEPTFTFWRQPNDTFPMGNIVYFLYSAGRIKIGYSDGLRTRLSILATNSPFPPVAVLVMRGTIKLERQFHARFAGDLVHGEWFTLSDKLRGFLRVRLCPVGRASLEKAEGAFRAYCKEQLA